MAQEDDSVTQALRSMADARLVMRMDPDAPVCPGCGRRFYEPLCEYPREVLGEIVKVCDDCADDIDLDLDVETWRELVSCLKPLHPLHQRSKFRGMPL